MSDEIPLIDPVEYTFEDKKGNQKTYLLSDFNAVDGREIIARYPLTLVPKFGGEPYEANKEVMKKLMNHVAVKSNGQILRLSTEALINNHCPDYEVLGKIEMEMMKKNCSFFQDGRSWDFLENLAQLFIKRVSETLIHSLEQSSPTEKQPSTSLEPSTT